MENKMTNVDAATINYQFTAIPTNLFLILDNNCRSTLFALIQLSTYYAKNDGYFYRTNSDLEFETNLSKNVLNAALDALFVNGIIDVVPSAKGKGKKQSGKSFKVNFEKFLEYESISIEDAMKNEEYKIYTPNYKGTYTPSFNNVTKCNTTLVTTSVPTSVPTLVNTLVPTLVKSDNNINNIDNIKNINNKNNIYNKEYINNNIINKIDNINNIKEKENNKEKEKLFEMFNFDKNVFLNKHKQEIENKINKLANSTSLEELDNNLYSIVNYTVNILSKHNCNDEDGLKQITDKIHNYYQEVRNKLNGNSNENNKKTVTTSMLVEVENKPSQSDLIKFELEERLAILSGSTTENEKKDNLYSTLGWLDNLPIEEREKEALMNVVYSVYKGNAKPKQVSSISVSAVGNNNSNLVITNSGMGVVVEDELPF